MRGDHSLVMPMASESKFRNAMLKLGLVHFTDELLVVLIEASAKFILPSLENHQSV